MIGSIVRLDPALDALVPRDARIEKLAGEFQFTEGPLWRPEGALWFSDVVGNVVRQWTPDGKVIEILRPGGYDKNDAPPGPVQYRLPCASTFMPSGRPSSFSAVTSKNTLPFRSAPLFATS